MPCCVRLLWLCSPIGVLGSKLSCRRNATHAALFLSDVLSVFCSRVLRCLLDDTWVYQATNQIDCPVCRRYEGTASSFSEWIPNGSRMVSMLIKRYRSRGTADIYYVLCTVPNVYQVSRFQPAIDMKYEQCSAAALQSCMYCTLPASCV